MYWCTLYEAGATRGKSDSADFLFCFQSRHTCTSVSTSSIGLAKKRRVVTSKAHQVEGQDHFSMAQSRLGSIVVMVDQLPTPNINKKLPPELLTIIFQFLPYDDLKNALLVCRWVGKP